MKLSFETKAMLSELYKGRNHVELTIATLKNGNITSIHYGPDKKKSEEELIYPVGSISKPFTASLLAKYMEEGKITLDDSVDKFIPDLPEMYYPTIRRLATHHSGYGLAPYSFPQMLWMLLRMNTENGILHMNPFRGFPDEQDMIHVLKTKKLKNQDYKFEYCNFAYGLLGYIIGKLAGSDYFTAMEDYFASLGLENTSLKNSQMTGYDKKGNPCKPWQWEKTDIIAPAGAPLSTMEDLLKFARINMDGSAPYMAMCHQVYADGEKSQFNQGLGWRIKKDSNISYHVGNAGAFSCILAMNHDNQTAVAIGLNYAMVEIEELAFQILEDMKM